MRVDQVSRLHGPHAAVDLAADRTGFRERLSTARRASRKRAAQARLNPLSARCSSMARSAVACTCSSSCSSSMSGKCLFTVCLL